MSGMPREGFWRACRTGARVAAVAGAALVAACSGFPGGDLFSNGRPPPAPAQPSAIGTGQVRVGLILPLTATGNAGLAGQSMKNAAEMALAEFNNPNVQLLVKDDGGTGPGAQQATQQALSEGAEIILGPLFAHTVSAAGQVARARGVPVIAFSTDASVAGRGVYLLSFLPESDVDRVIEYGIANGKRSFAALVPDNAYGSVVEAEFKQVVARKDGRVVALERYPLDKLQMQEPVKRVAQASAQVDAVFIPDAGDTAAIVAQILAANGVDAKRVQLMGTSVWENPGIFQEPAVRGGWFAGPDPNSPNGYGKFAARYRARFGQNPERIASLAYDSVSLVSALVKSQGPQRFSETVLTNPSGFSGVDGIFRFRPDGTNQRGLAVLRVTPSGGQVINPAPRAFDGSGT